MNSRAFSFWPALGPISATGRPDPNDAGGAGADARALVVNSSALVVTSTALQFDAKKKNGPAMPSRMGSRSFFVLKPGPHAGAESDEGAA